jgi:putative spermidine/putrescine transport system permease protein
LNALRRDAGWWALLLPAFLLMTVLYVAPIVQVLAISVTEPQPGFGNYERLLTNAGVHRVIGTTIRVCALTTALALLLGYALSYVIALARPRGAAVVAAGVLVPLWISVLVRAFAWVTLLRQQGLVNQGLQAVGLVDEPLRLVWNEFGIVVGMVHYMVPYAVLPMLAGDAGDRPAAAGRRARPGRLAPGRLPPRVPALVAARLGRGGRAGVHLLARLLHHAGDPGRRQDADGRGVDQAADLWISCAGGMGTMLATVLVVAILATLALFSRVVDLDRLFGGARA